MNSLDYKKLYSDSLSLRSYNITIGLAVLGELLMTFFSTFALADSVGVFYINHPFIFTIIYFVGCMICGSVAMSSRSNITSFIMYLLQATLVGGLFSSVIPYIGGAILVEAAGATLFITISFIIIASIYPEFFLKLGGVLCCSLILDIIIEGILCLFFGIDFAIFDWIVVGIFSLYIGYDWSRGMCYPKCVRCALATAEELYWDIVNIFIRLVEILLRSQNDKD